jgi:phage tail tape-measure protein
MATVAQLNIEIGARVAELQKGLKSAEKSLSQSGARMSRIGNDITTSLSIPLGLAGVGAIKAAGDIESLTLALKSQLGTAEAAATELNKLTEAAKNPGLGLEQAVRGSVRLQGVGFEAEETRKVLVQMGNAIAATGGSAQELDNVTRQFAQMTSKGRVLQEDVSILSENMPALRS